MKMSFCRFRATSFLRQRRLLISVCGALLTLQTSASPGLTVVPLDEPANQAIPPNSANPAIPAANFNLNGGPTINLVTVAPLICANTAAPANSPATLINPIYYSVHGAAGSSPQPFVFGASSTAPAISMRAAGATRIFYDGSQLGFAGDPLDALVCYGTDAAGVHKLTRDLFLSDFDSVMFNSTVTVSVFHIPTSTSDYYGYAIDVTIPPLPGGTNCDVNGLDCNFALVEGYDTSVFDTANGQWCLAPAQAQSCVIPAPAEGTTPTNGNINLNYSNFPTTAFLKAPIAPAVAKQYHFVAFRYLKQGMTMVPTSGSPVVMAALFSPLDLGENKLDDNVAMGNNKVANVAPHIVQNASLANFISQLTSLHEDTDSGALTFDVSDPDTIEPATGPYLNAKVDLLLPNGIRLPVVTECKSISTVGTLPVSRTCTVDIPLNDGTFWDPFVDTDSQGKFNDFATDVTNGTYALGLSANAQIVLIDSAGKQSTPVSFALHVNSTKNDLPMAVFSAALPVIPDPRQEEAPYPTYSCSILAGDCGATFHIVDLVGSIMLQPGPAAAFDELKSQSINVTDVQCGQLGEDDSIFTNLPVVTPTSGMPDRYDVAFQLTASAGAIGSSLCRVMFEDGMPVFPNGESAVANAGYFRVLVNQ